MFDDFSGETWEISVKHRNLLGFVWRNRFPSGILFLKLEIPRDAQRDHHISGEQKEEGMGKENEHEKALGEGVDDPRWGL